MPTVRLSIDNQEMARANAGKVPDQDAICIQYKKAVLKGGNLFIRWSTLSQNIKEVAPDSHPTLVVQGTLDISTTRAADSHDDVGEGGCGCECTGCDQKRHCQQRERGCKHA